MYPVLSYQYWMCQIPVQNSMLLISEGYVQISAGYIIVCSQYQQSTLYVPNIRVHCMYPISEYTVCTQYQSTLYVPNIRVHCMYPISVKETTYVPYISRVHKYQQKTVWLCIPYQYHLKWKRVTDESKEIPFKPLHDKTNAITCVPSEDSDQPGHSPSLIRVFAVRMKKHYVLATLRTYSEDSV